MAGAAEERLALQALARRELDLEAGTLRKDGGVKKGGLRLKANALRLAACALFSLFVFVVLGGSIAKAREGLALPNPRADAVREAIAWAFDGYAQHAWGHDELRPISRSGMDSVRPPLSAPPLLRVPH
jgi:hypothetical protein